MPGKRPEIDLAKIQFPSDSWTISKLRKIWPESFDDLGGDDHCCIESTLGGVIDTERVYAKLVFREALSLDSEPGRLRDPSSDMLNLMTDYIATGRAAGKHEAKELVNQIKSQALAQAEAFLKRSKR